MWSIFRISSLFDIYLRVFFASISDELTSIIRSYEVNHRVLDTVLYNSLSPPTYRTLFIESVAKAKNKNDSQMDSQIDSKEFNNGINFLLLVNFEMHPFKSDI